MNSPQESQNFKLIHGIGETHNKSDIVDSQFGVSIRDSVKLIRKVEMYQWVEHRRKQNKSYVYTYNPEWKSHVVSSSNFQHGNHHNPSDMPYNPNTILGEKVTFGSFELADSQKEKCHASKMINLNQAQIQELQELTGNTLHAKGYSNFSQEGLFFVSRKDDKRLNNSGYEIGDIRVQFEHVPCGYTTIIAQQILKGSTFTFRKWNPKKENVPIGENNDPDFQVVCGGCSSCVDKCF